MRLHRPSTGETAIRADVSTMEGLRESMKLLTPANFRFPFLAHALGTLAGAFVAAKIAVSHPTKFAIGIGLFLLIGGVTAVAMLGGPVWFAVLDLLVAYIPMGILGGWLAGLRSRTTVGLSVQWKDSDARPRWLDGDGAVDETSCGLLPQVLDQS